MSGILNQRLFSYLSALVIALHIGLGLAHATLVIGTLSTVPETPEAGEPFTLRLSLTDPVGNPTEDALVFAEFTPAGGEDMTSFEFSETEAGIYETEVTLPEEGSYDLLMRDQTFRQEEVNANLLISLGGGQLFPADNTFIFPPTSAAPEQGGLGTWLIWVIALPIVAGLATTIIVLRGSSRDEELDDL